MVKDKRTGEISACKMFDLGYNDEDIQEVVMLLSCSPADYRNFL